MLPYWACWNNTVFCLLNIHATQPATVISMLQMIGLAIYQSHKVHVLITATVTVSIAWQQFEYVAHQCWEFVPKKLHSFNGQYCKRACLSQYQNLVSFWVWLQQNATEVTVVTDNCNICKSFAPSCVQIITINIPVFI